VLLNGCIDYLILIMQLRSIIGECDGVCAVCDCAAKRKTTPHHDGSGEIRHFPSCPYHTPNLRNFPYPFPRWKKSFEIHFVAAATHRFLRIET
jgi:hypothetical protein